MSRVDYIETGSGPTVMFLHGSVVGPGFKYQLEVFAQAAFALLPGICRGTAVGFVEE
ncbi:MAG: hypothetical protein CM1200mP18_21890 [Gammaproteobacteria bacterium]|nr:MAG: hypothetical protein CM1200mP18_21890 [Gammaproteobacteria bacterium]